ncbi:MAG: PAS domain S-box protein [Terriglobales bacterium]
MGTSSQPPVSKEDSGPIPASEGAGAKSVVRSRIQTRLAYLLAVVLTVVVLLLRLALSSRFGDHPGLELFLIPIVLSAFAGGLGPGLISTALAGIATDYFLLPPKYSLSIHSGLHSLEWLVLILAGTLMSVLLRKRSRGFPGAAAYSLSNERPEMSSDSESSVSRTILISAGSTCAALGAVTLVGWFFHISALTRVAPAFNPMMANIAVGLFLDGLVLLFLAAGWPKAALVGAVWSLLAGILTLAEFGFSIDLHIDELLVRDYLRVLPAFPGRPAPNAALCLVLCGGALLWASVPRWREKAAVIIGVLGGVVFALGAAAVSGYVIGVPMYAFGSSKPMAANAGFGFVAMGLGVMALAWRRSQPSPEAEARILFSTERKVRAGFALALAALIVIGGVSYFSLVRLHEDRVSVDHSYQVIVALRLVLSTITDAETGERGFIITGQEGFLQPYQQAVSSLRADLGSLRRLTADNRMQQGRLDALEPLVAERLLLLQQAVEARRGTGFPAAQPIVATGRGKQIHDRIREILAEMEATEQALLRERGARAHHAGRVARTVIVAGITLAFVFVVVALFVIGADFAGSRRARVALQEARDQLETRVLQRTAELAKAQQAALGSEARLAGIIDSAMDAILTVDEQHRIVLFNPAAEKMFGCPAATALGQPLDRFMPERFRAAHVQHHHAFGETGVTQREMERLGSLCGLRSSGEEFPIEAAISRVDLEGQKLFTAILRDITERVAAEEALRSSEARFRSLVENSADAIAMQDAEGKILYVSSPVKRILGYRPEEFVGHNVLEFIHPEEHEQFEAVRRSLPESLQPVLTRFRTRHKDGSWRVVESIRSNQLDNPDVRSVVINFRDVTEAVSIAETLRRQAALFNQTYDAVMVWNWGGPITFWNRGAERLYGYNLREVIGKNPHQLLRTETPGGVESFLSVLEQTNTWEGESEHVTRDGRKIIVESRMTLVRDKDLVYVLEANRDITERKRAQAEIQLLNEDLERRVGQRTAELEAANKELESFSYSVAHDLRAPLRAVDGFSDALLEDYGPQLPQEARKYLQTIRGAAQRMGCLIDDLLAFSRLGRQPLTKQPVDMDVLVLGVLEDVVPEGREKNIEIVNGNLPATHGDPALLRQVWANLLSNAIKYSRHAEQARIEIGALEEAQRNVYFVRDNGAGFDMKYADKLFGVFQRLHRADEFEGTGIGLAIVQRVVHRHGGQVWAEAKLNEGATFYFTLEGGT